MKKIILILFLFAATVFTLWASQESYQGEESGILDNVSNCIKKNHPNPFTKITEKEFDAEIKNLKTAWNNKTEVEKYFSLRKLAASIGDGHTEIFGAITAQKVLPFFVLPYGSHSIIVQASKEYQDLVGKELISINNIGIQKVVERLMPLISYDTKGKAVEKAHYECRLSASLEFTGIINSSEKTDISVKNIETGELKTFTVSFLKAGEQIREPVFASFAPTLFQSGYYRANILQDGILFIQYNICANAPDLPMSDFASIIKEKFSVNIPKKIIVDLRHNKGGDSTIVKPLIQTLKTLSEKGSSLFCLIGSETFSSGVMAAQDLKKIGAVLIGEECGWNGKFGEVKELKLSESFTLLYSTKDFSSYFENKTLQPDKVVLPNLNDLTKGLDTCIEYIK